MGNLRLREIWIYPVKSLGGIRLKASTVAEKGLPFDRRWMLVDEQGIFMTQRNHPEMALFSVSLNSEELSIRLDGTGVSVPIAKPSNRSTMKATIWEDTVEVLGVKQSANEWFSEKLKRPCKLVAFPEENSRPVDTQYAIQGEQVSLADAYPFLILGELSLADLNKRLEEPLPMNRFRPTFVFSGGEPYEEDTWRNFRIGNNRFVGVKPCSRCAVTTVNQATGETGREPLSTLASYRKREGKVYFGQNVIAVDHGEISEGDEIVLG